MNPASSSSPGPASTTSGLTLAQYLIRRLQDYGIRHVFGIPGDYILGFYTQLERSPIQTIGCTREDCAGFAADAYARCNGMGAVCVTYCVGGLSVCNSIAGAFAEKSPVVVITGSPGLRERVNSPLLHHKVRDFRTQLEVFEKICVAATELTDPSTAFREIDRVLDAVARFKRPGYIDLPRDLVNVVPSVSYTYQKPDTSSDPLVLQEAGEEAARLLTQARKPIILAGVEIHRFGLQDRLLALAEQSGIPIVSTLLGKSVIRETHPLYAGLYEGAMGHAAVTQFVEESDCVLILGAFMTDINLGIYTANLDPSRCLYATSEQLRIRHHHFQGVNLGDFLEELIRRNPATAPRPLPAGLPPRNPPYVLQPEAPLTISRLMARLNEQLDDTCVVIADVGDSLFAATDLVMSRRTEFLSPAYYTSMGFSVPAALGVHFAQPDRRAVVICGDGAFQMTGQEFSSLVRHGFAPIVIVNDNSGYGTERALHPGDWKFNEIHGWNYSRLTEVYRGGTGYEVRTEGEFDQALTKAWADTSGPSLIHVHTSREDGSETLRRLGERMSQTI